jgi:putative ABC transport system substrate-binding protein
MAPLHHGPGDANAIIGKALQLFVILALGVLSVPPATGAPQPGKIYKIGVLHPGSGSEERLAALREAGHVEGQNLVIAPRHAQGRLERLPALARELVGLKPDIILATSNSAIQAAKDATKSIPIVMAFSDDPVALGLVASLARPGGNVTGVTLTAAGTLAAKRMELLKEALPTSGESRSWTGRERIRHRQRLKCKRRSWRLDR